MLEILTHLKIPNRGFASRPYNDDNDDDNKLVVSPPSPASNDDTISGQNLLLEDAVMTMLVMIPIMAFAMRVMITITIIKMVRSHDLKICGDVY